MGLKNQAKLVPLVLHHSNQLGAGLHERHPPWTVVFFRAWAAFSRRPPGPESEPVWTAGGSSILGLLDWCTRAHARRDELSALCMPRSPFIFQYNVLTIDDTRNTWTNICVKMIIIRLIGTRDEKIQNLEEIRSKGPRHR